MKNTLLISTIASLALLMGASSAVMASGSHSGGHHDDGDMDGMDMGHGSAHWMAPSAAAEQKNPVAASASSLARGSKLYQANCAACHGANADGKGMAGMMLNPKPANLREMAGSHPDGDFAYKIREGRGAMPSWKNSLAEKDVWHLVNYIQNLSGDMAESEDHDGHGDSHEHEHKH